MDLAPNSCHAQNSSSSQFIDIYEIDSYHRITTHGLALQSIKSVTGEAVESICTKYSQRGTAPWWALLRPVLSLENILMHPWKGDRERGKEEGWGSGSSRSKLTLSIASSVLTLEARSYFKVLSSPQTRTLLPSPKRGPTAWSWELFPPSVLHMEKNREGTAHRAHRLTADQGKQHRPVLALGSKALSFQTGLC